MDTKVVEQKSTNPIKTFFEKPLVQNKIKELVGKNASSFATSILQVVNSNEMLRTATPESIFSAACMAATLNLPINSNLGFAHIVPYRNTKTNTTEAQFQLGWKGFVQLAQRSGQFKKISTAVAHEGQLIKSDPLQGYEFNWDAHLNNKPTIGYVAYFQLLNGFEAYLYMTIEEVKEHGLRYSQSFKKGYGVWVDNFDAMALKTVLKLLLSKQAPLSVEMQKAILADQAVIEDVDGDFQYTDNDIVEIEKKLCPDDVIDDGLKAIDRGKSADEVITSINTTYSLSDEQITRLKGEQ